MVMTAVVLVLRPANCRLIRKEVWAMGAASLILFGVSYAVLFHLYLPNRYTYPLIPFFCIVIAVSWYPLWNSYGEKAAVAASGPRRRRARCSRLVRRHEVRPGPVAPVDHSAEYRRRRLGDHRLLARRGGGAGRGRVLPSERPGDGRADRAVLRRPGGIPADGSRDRSWVADQQGARLQQGPGAVRLPADIAEVGDHRGRSEGDRLRTDRGRTRGGHLTKAVPAVRLHVSEDRAPPNDRHAASVLWAFS